MNGSKQDVTDIPVHFRMKFLQHATPTLLELMDKDEKCVLIILKHVYALFQGSQYESHEYELYLRNYFKIYKSYELDNVDTWRFYAQNVTK